MADLLAFPGSGAHMPHFGRIVLTLVWLEAILYGANFLIFGASLYVLLRRIQRNWILVFWSIAIFALASADAIIAFLEIYQPLTDKDIIGVPGAWDASYQFPDMMYFTHFAISNIVIIAQNLLLIWRLYAVWGGDWKIIIVPLALEISHTVLFCLAARLLRDPAESSYSDEMQQLAYPINIIVLFLNFTVTIAIAGRLWWHGWKNQVHFGSFTYRASIFTFIESGALFTTTTLVNFFFTISGSSIGGILSLYIVVQLASITPLSIIVRVGLGLTHGSQTEQYPSTRPSFARGPAAGLNALSFAREPDEEYDMASFGASSNTIVGEESSTKKITNDAFLEYYMS